MNVLFVSGELIGSEICHQLIKEGHAVKLYVHQPRWKGCLDGIVPKVADWKEHVEWAGKDGLIIFDDTGFGAEQTRLRNEGYTVVGGSEGGDKLELDRAFFHSVLREHDMPVLPSYNFNSKQEAIEHVRQHPARWVIKQSSHYGVLTYVGEREDGADTAGILESYDQPEYFPLHLQQFAQGIEVGVARYFNGTDWVGPIEINHEYKRLCNDDIGPLTGEMGTVMWYSDDESLPLFARTLAKLKPYLQSIDFRGDIDINCIVDAHDAWPLEATSRFGTPATELQGELTTSPWGAFLRALARGESYDLTYKKGYGVVVSIVVPPYPYPPHVATSAECAQGVQLFLAPDTTTTDLSHIHFEEISCMRKDGSADMYYWSGAHGCALHVTGSADSITAAQKDVYALIQKITIPKMFYRTDIGTRVETHDLPQLRAWGWI